MVKLNYISFLILAFCSISVFAQRTYETNPDAKRANIWYFRKNAGVNFNTNPPTALVDGKINSIEEGGCVMCDTAGNILFYTDGRTVWNKNHDTMENGFDLAGGHSASQTGLCLKHPNNDSIYYIFNTPNLNNYSDGLSYNIINIKLKNKLGEVIIKNKKLHHNSSEKISAVYHANGKDIWIIGHEYGNNRFFKYILKEDGINTCPITQDIGVVYTFIPPFLSEPFINAGFLKFSSNNNYLVHRFNPESIQTQYRRFELFDFDNSNAHLSLNNEIYYDRIAWGVEFSSNSENIVFTDIDSFSTIYNIKTKQKKYINLRFLNEAPYLQLAIDGNIYFANRDSSFVSIIKNSDDFNNVKVIQKNLDIQTGKYLFSLPNFFIGYLTKPSINFTYNLNCNSNTINLLGLDTFNATTYKWLIYKSNINNPITTSLEKNYTYTFKDTGLYNICFIANNNTIKDTLIKNIFVTPKINNNFLGNDTAYPQGTVINKILKAPSSYCYLWQDSSTLSSFVADTIGIYYCNILSHSYCNISDTFFISYCEDSLVIPQITRINDSIFISNTLNSDSFIWYKNNVEILKSNQKYLKLTDTGSYKVVAMKQGYCIKTSSEYIVHKLGLNNPTINNIKIYPNPNGGMFKILNFNNEVMQFNITSVIGEKVYTSILVAGENIIHCNLPSGLYILTIKEKNLNKHHKLIIQ